MALALLGEPRFETVNIRKCDYQWVTESFTMGRTSLQHPCRTHVVRSIGEGDTQQPVRSAAFRE
jgi:hypothetical protein